ncbi:hypothetical protein [Pandoraea fibrosis]|uniref:Uncharacterized protein n=1 Tax=Pandoraea fibrosis TaxID=1891094 RepID=A0A5E4XH04_9BURK|nr:hypothetical protein [Pandoraea fibrosis]VVE35681.1 hypothetical protein PFI31113_03849 [Pandoraea fibrosis]
MVRRDDFTPDLFEVPRAPELLDASMAFRDEVAALANTVLSDAGASREIVAAEVSRLVGGEVTKHTLDSWTAASRTKHNIPFHLVPVVEAACKSHALSNWLAEKRGGRLLVGRDALTAELGKLERTRDEAGKRIKALKRVMGAHNS